MNSDADDEVVYIIYSKVHGVVVNRYGSSVPVDESVEWFPPADNGEALREELSSALDFDRPRAEELDE